MKKIGKLIAALFIALLTMYGVFILTELYDQWDPCYCGNVYTIAYHRFAVLFYGAGILLAMLGVFGGLSFAVVSIFDSKKN